VVEDDGPGIPPAHLSQLFDPFFTTKVNGTGLGLSVCKTLVEEHGGSITVKSLPEKGVSFTVWLPALLEGDASVREPGGTPSGLGSEPF